jgi:hypothetical protein
MRIRETVLRVLIGLSLMGGLSACDLSSLTNPEYLANTGGGVQTVAIGAQAAQPLTVTVTNMNRDPLKGVTVNWAITSGGGSLSATSTATNGDGVTSVTFTAGATAGTTVIAASVPSLGAAVGFTMTVK